MNTRNANHGQRSAINWSAEMDTAIAHGDERAMWNALYQHPDQEEAHRRMSGLVPRLAYQVGATRLRMAELFLAPVICAQDHPVLTDEAAWCNYEIGVADAINSWFQVPDRINSFSGVRPYDWVGSWRPSVLREHLMSVMPGAAKPHLEFKASCLDLPPEAPRLGFLMLAVTCSRGWLDLSGEPSAKDRRFQAVISGLFQRSDDETPAMVLRPDHVQYAVSGGLRAWLTEMHKVVPLTGWTVTPHLSHIDVVKVTLKLESAKVPFMQFPIRKHQASLEGIKSVLGHLSTIAPMLDGPMDFRKAVEKRVALDLT